MPNLLLLMIAGACGTAARFGVSVFAQRWLGSASLGTLAVNVVGTFLLALVATLTIERNVAPAWKLVIGTGFCGALTTFSTFALEAEELWRRAPLNATAYVAANLIFGLAAVVLGRWLVTR